MITIPFLNSFKTATIKPTVLLILDGFGIAPDSEGNAITQAKTPNMDRYRAEYLYGILIAAGESVGLPANDDGNSEVGHLTIGAGRVVDQSLVRINKSIEDTSFYQNSAFLDSISHIKSSQGKLHIMGLVGSGYVHSSVNHLYALIELCKRNNLKNVCFHLFTDGRDSPPTDGIKVIKEIETRLTESGVGVIATVMGRYYAMDRDGRWERTQIAYDSLVSGTGQPVESILSGVQASYDAGKTDEFIAPIVTASGNTRIENNDSVIFFNFRIDRPRQLTMAFTVPNFESMKLVDFGYMPDKHTASSIAGPTFKRSKILSNLSFVSMTEYQKNLPVTAIAYPPPVVTNSLPEVISKSNLKQMHIAESEKERMVAFYMDGLIENRFEGEDVEIVASPKVATYDKKPEMNVWGIVKKFKKALSRDIYPFVLMNFANPDMVAHCGNFEATVTAIEEIDKAVGVVVSETLKRDGSVFITADHGNAEELLTYKRTGFYFTTDAGGVNTEHSNNPVPLFVIGNSYRKSLYKIDQSITEYNFKGALQDVAPTVLKAMNLPIPSEMTGKYLLAELAKGSN